MSYTVFDANHTSNQSDLFRDLFADVNSDAVVFDKPAWGLHKLNGMTGKQVCAVLNSVLLKAQDLQDLSAYDSPNGWGSGTSAVAFLGQIACQCAMNPRRKVQVLC